VVAHPTSACREKRGRFSLRLRPRLFCRSAFGKTHGVGRGARRGSTGSIVRSRGVTESSADARGPASRSARGAADKTSIVLTLPHQRTPADAPIMALGRPLPSRRPLAGRPSAGLDRSAGKRPRESVSAPGGMLLMSHQREGMNRIPVSRPSAFRVEHNLALCHGSTASLGCLSHRGTMRGRSRFTSGRWRSARRRLGRSIPRRRSFVEIWRRYGTYKKWRMCINQEL